MSLSWIYFNQKFRNINVPQHIHIIATNQFPGWMCSVKRQTYSLTETEDSYESSIGEGGVPLRKLVPNSEKWREFGIVKWVNNNVNWPP